MSSSGGEVAHSPHEATNRETSSRYRDGSEFVELESYARMALSVDLRTEVHTRADRLSVAYRRVLADLMDQAV